MVFSFRLWDYGWIFKLGLLYYLFYLKGSEMVRGGATSRCAVPNHLEIRLAPINLHCGRFPLPSAVERPLSLVGAFWSHPGGSSQPGPTTRKNQHLPLLRRLTASASAPCYPGLREVGGRSAALGPSPPGTLGLGGQGGGGPGGVGAPPRHGEH